MTKRTASSKHQAFRGILWKRKACRMATEEHKRLAGIVKGTHALLRAEYHQYGAAVAWERHLARNDMLQVCQTHII